MVSRQIEWYVPAKLVTYVHEANAINSQVPVLNDVRDITLVERQHELLALISYENKAPPQLWKLEIVKDREGRESSRLGLRLVTPLGLQPHLTNEVYTRIDIRTCPRRPLILQARVTLGDKTTTWCYVLEKVSNIHYPRKHLLTCHYQLEIYSFGTPNPAYSYIISAHKLMAGT